MKILILKMLVTLTMLPNLNIHAQDVTTIRGPISAIRMDGERLLLGQGSSLIEARLSEHAVEVIRTTNVQRHEIRAITTNQGITFALSEDGLTTLDSSGNVVDFVRGGGQRLTVINGRVYIAALQAGVRVLTVDPAGKLSPLGIIPTLGPARDLAPEINGLVWVAEEDQGIRLYDAQNIAAVKPITWVKTLAPATAVRINGTRIVVGHNGTLTTLDTLNATAPSIVSTIALDTSEVNDLIIAGNRAFVGMKGTAGNDLIVLDLSILTAPQIIAKLGTSGAGEWLAYAAKSNVLFIGSGRLGLRRLNVAGPQPVIVQAWDAVGSAQPCQLSEPALLQPANGDEVSGATITLQWISPCAASYEIRVNGEIVGTTADTTFSLTPNIAQNTWQIVAIGESGQQTDSPTWTFDLDVQGWLATPASLHNAKLLYTPPVAIVDMNSPQQVLMMTCAALLAGFILVVVTAWYLGMRAEQRRMRRL